MLRRLFDASYRKARALEAQGDHRAAAALYAEAGANDEAASALLFAAARITNPKDREVAFTSALRFLNAGDARVRDAELGAARAIVEDLSGEGSLLAEDKARLRRAATTLEQNEDYELAKHAFERASDQAGVARCLVKLGEVEALESVLADDVAEDARTRNVQRAIASYEQAMSLGARLEARLALTNAREAAPGNRSIEEMLERLDARFPQPRVVTLKVGDVRCTFVGKTSLAVGRDADLAVRGTSVSRQHAEISLSASGVSVRDLGSRNGTLVARMPIAGRAELSGEVELGLGDDVRVQVRRHGATLEVRVVDGPDRGAVGIASEGASAVPGARAAISFTDGRATLSSMDDAPLWLSGIRVTLPIVLLVGDSVEVDGVRVEVVA